MSWSIRLPCRTYRQYVHIELARDPRFFLVWINSTAINSLWIGIRKLFFFVACMRRGKPGLCQTKELLKQNLYQHRNNSPTALRGCVLCLHVMFMSWYGRIHLTDGAPPFVVVVVVVAGKAYLNSSKLISQVVSTLLHIIFSSPRKSYPLFSSKWIPCSTENSHCIHQVHSHKTGIMIHTLQP